MAYFVRMNACSELTKYQLHLLKLVSRRQDILSIMKAENCISGTRVPETMNDVIRGNAPYRYERPLVLSFGDRPEMDAWAQRGVAVANRGWSVTFRRHFASVASSAANT